MAWALALAGCADLLDIPESPHLVASEVTAPDSPQPELPPARGNRGSGGSASELATPGDDPGGSSEGGTSPIGAPMVPPPDSLGPDAFGSDGGIALDAGEVDAATLTADAEPPCSGVRLFGICWYLGALGASCTTTCAAHGGYAEAATARIGAAAQGGSGTSCSSLLLALGERTPAAEANRTDGVGIGCHVFGTERDPYWLIDDSFTPSNRLALARVVCGCNE